MASADFSPFVVTTVLCTADEISPNKNNNFPLYRCQIYRRWLRTVMGLQRVWAPCPPYRPSICFLFVSARFCLRLPSDSSSRWTPLLSANTSHCRAYSGLSPPSYCPCRAYQQKIPESLPPSEILLNSYIQTLKTNLKRLRQFLPEPKWQDCAAGPGRRHAHPQQP